MESEEVPATDSGYPTPREDLPTSSRSESPPFSPYFAPLTSTPLRGKQHQRLRDPLGPRSNSLSEELSTIAETDESGLVIQGVKSLLSLAKETKTKRRENAALHDENDTLRDENEYLRDENLTLREESRRIELLNASLRHDNGENSPPPVVPRLNLDDEKRKPVSMGSLKITDEIKKELLSFIKNEEDRTVLEGKLEHMLSIDCKPTSSNVYTATATVQVNTENMDADVQTENDDHANVINANLKIEVDQLCSQLEETEKKNVSLKNRLFDFEKLKAKFEENEEKLRNDLEKKLKASQEKVNRYENKIEELELRLSKKRKEHEEMRAENQRLVEDRNTHEFEIDELKVHSEEVEKKWKKSKERIVELENEMEELEDKLKEEIKAKIELEKESERMKIHFEKCIEELKRQTDEAYTEKAEALEHLDKIEIENKKILKENEYLTVSQQARLESETSLKSERDVLTATLRNVEQTLLSVQEQLAEEQKLRQIAEDEVSDLGIINQQLEIEKRDVDELLDELKKGKLEIDYLRQEVKRASEETDEVRQLREELYETQKRAKESEEKFMSAQKNNDGFIERHEENIRVTAAKDVELVRLRQEVVAQNERIEKMTAEVSQSGKIVEELQRALETVEHEYDDFKTHANLQYHDEIGQRDEQILHLRERLVELETYPGQTISVSKKNAESQTDEPEKPNVGADLSPEVTLVSEESEQLERNINMVIDKMEELIQGRSIANIPPSFQSDPGTEYHCAETFRQVVEILRDLLTHTEAPIELTQNFWVALNQRMELQETVFKEKLNTGKKLAFDEAQRIEADCKSKLAELKIELNAVRKTAEERLYLANEFKIQYEIEMKEKEEQAAEYARLTQMREEELIEWEKSDKALRERLEQAQRTEQENARVRIKRADNHEEAMEEMRNAFAKIEKDLKFRLRMTEEELMAEKKRREYDRTSMTSMQADFKAVEEKCEYLKQRNGMRQAMLNHLRSVLLKCQRSTDREKTMQYLTGMQDQLDRSGLLIEGETSSRSSRERKQDEYRRPLGYVNKSQ